MANILNVRSNNNSNTNSNKTTNTNTNSNNSIQNLTTQHQQQQQQSMGFQEVQTDFGNQISSLRSQIALTPPQTPPNMKVCVVVAQINISMQNIHTKKKKIICRNYQMWPAIWCHRPMELALTTTTLPPTIWITIKILTAMAIKMPHLSHFTRGTFCTPINRSIDWTLFSFLSISQIQPNLH